MKLTKSQLKQIIKEEYGKAILEAAPTPVWDPARRNPRLGGREETPEWDNYMNILKSNCMKENNGEIKALFDSVEQASDLLAPSRLARAEHKLDKCMNSELLRAKEEMGPEELNRMSMTEQNSAKKLKMKLPKSQLQKIIKEELEDALAETRWGTSKPSVPKKRWCVKYKVDGGETQYKAVSATAGGTAETTVKRDLRKQDETVEIVSTKELDSGQKCGAQ